MRIIKKCVSGWLRINTFKFRFNGTVVATVNNEPQAKVATFCDTAKKTARIFAAWKVFRNFAISFKKHTVIAKEISKNSQYVRFDWAIKRILRDHANKQVLEGLISVLIGIPVTIIEILESENNKVRREDKKMIIRNHPIVGLKGQQPIAQGSALGMMAAVSSP